jgi:cellulose synthase/poly-beta-1,6-N-acetylglucosamine synthase-like glycosyltransferase
MAANQDMPKAKPRVSIGMPVYNADQFVDEALKSLVTQSFEDFELTICDNASTDNTQDICRAYGARDGRIRYLRNETNIGGKQKLQSRVHDVPRRVFQMGSRRRCLSPGPHRPLRRGAGSRSHCGAGLW